MAFDSDRARIDPGYYDEYEAEVAAKMAQYDSLGSRVSSGSFNQLPEDLQTMGARVEELLKGARAHIGFRPFTHRLVKVQGIEVADNLPEPYSAVGLKAFHELLPVHRARLVHTRLWAQLGSQPNAPSMEFGVSFDGETVTMPDTSTKNIRIPYTSEGQYQRVAALNVLTILEEHKADG
jgi:hypothetical protein